MRLEVTHRDRQIGRWKFCCRGAILGLVLLLGTSLPGAEQTLPVLNVGSQTYSNVTVTTKTSRYIMIMHAHGLASIKLKDLSPDTLQELGYKVEPPAPKPQRTFVPQNIEIDPRIKEMEEKTVEEVKGRFQRLDPKMLWGVFAGMFLVYLFFCHCSKLICKKAGHEPGALVWIPIVQTFPMLRAAGMSAWWFLLWLVPVANVGVSILWCVKICQARGKSSWLAVPLALPITSLFTFLYLAFADGTPGEDAAPQRITFN
jgi:hypothetical protein